MNQTPERIAADIIRLAGGSLFDRDWYAATYAEVLAGGGDPLVQFCDTGWRKGMNPNPMFDTAFYLAANPDVAAAGINPLLHYADYGEAQDRRPAEDFDVAWYRATHEIAAGENCLAHYLAHRHAGGVSPNGGFDAGWYRVQYGLGEAEDPFAHFRRAGMAADYDAAPQARLIRESGLFDAAFYRRVNGFEGGDAAALYHFCNIGWRRRLWPNPLFDTEWYLRADPAIEAAGVNPLFHYIQYGEYEGRRPSEAFDPVAYRQTHEVPPFVSSLGHRLLSPVEDPVPAPRLVLESELFDVNYYLANYPDVRESDLDPVDHFMTYGWREGRRPNPYFDPAWYARTYLPAAAADNPLLHYLHTGEAAGHRPIAYFDPGWYRTAYRLEEAERPLRHFLRHRRGQHHGPTPLFDIAWYMARHGAEIGPNRDPFAHYLRVGITADVDPGPGFDAARYRREHMDAVVPPSRPTPGAEIVEKLKREIFNPLVHYLTNQPPADG